MEQKRCDEATLLLHGKDDNELRSLVKKVEDSTNSLSLETCASFSDSDVRNMCQGVYIVSKALQDKQQELEQAFVDMEALEDEVEGLEVQVEGLEEEVVDKGQQLQEKQRELDQAETKIATLEQQKSQMSNANEKLLEEQQELSGRNHKLTTQMSLNNIKFQREKGQLENQITTLTGENQKLAEEKEAQQTISESIASIRREKNDYQLGLENLRREHQKLTGQYEALTSEKNTLVGQYEALTSKKNKLAGDNAALEKQLKAAQEASASSSSAVTCFDWTTIDENTRCDMETEEQRTICRRLKGDGSFWTEQKCDAFVHTCTTHGINKLILQKNKSAVDDFKESVCDFQCTGQSMNPFGFYGGFKTVDSQTMNNHKQELCNFTAISGW